MLETEKAARESVGGCRRGARSSCVGGVEEMGMNPRTIRRGSEIERRHHHHHPMRRALLLQLGGDALEIDVAVAGGRNERHGYATFRRAITSRDSYAWDLGKLERSVSFSSPT
jgi:hypothetical protein